MSQRRRNSFLSSSSSSEEEPGEVVGQGEGEALLIEENHPLHHAAAKGHTNYLEALLNNGASPNCFNQYGNTLLHLASMHGHNSSVEMLLQRGADLFAVNKVRPFLRLVDSLHRAGVGKNPVRDLPAVLHYELAQDRAVEVAVLMSRHGRNTGFCVDRDEFFVHLLLPSKEQAFRFKEQAFR